MRSHRRVGGPYDSEVSGTGPDSCPSCGRTRWVGDQFCARCGHALGSSPQPEQINLVESEPAAVRTAGVRTAKEQETSRGLKLGLIAVGLLLALGLGVSALLGGDDDRTEDTAAEPAIAEEQADAESEGVEGVEGTGATPTPAPTVTPEPVDETRSAVSPEDGAEAAAAVAAAAVAAAEAVAAGEDQPPEVLPVGFEDLHGYILTSTADGVDAYPLAGGDPIAVVHSSPQGFTVAFSGGGDFVTQTAGRGWNFRPADGSEAIPLDLGVGETVGFVLHDPDAGALVTVHNEGVTNSLVKPAVDVVQVTTGDRRTVEVANPLLVQTLVAWNGPTAATVDTLVLGTNDRIFRWTWNDDWVEIAEGVLEAAGGSWIITASCEDPANCRRELRSAHTGDLISEIDSELTLTPWGTRISPSGDWISFPLAETGSTSQVGVLNVATGMTSVVVGEAESSMWAGDKHLVLWDWDGGPLTIENVATGDRMRLDLPTEGFGPLAWVPVLTVLNGP